MREWGICFRIWAAVRCLQPLWEAFSWGIGVGLVVRAGGATGGDDVLALVLNKLAGVKIEKCYFFHRFCSAGALAELYSCA